MRCPGTDCLFTAQVSKLFTFQSARFKLYSSVVPPSSEVHCFVKCVNEVLGRLKKKNDLRLILSEISILARICKWIKLVKVSLQSVTRIVQFCPLQKENGLKTHTAAWLIPTDLTGSIDSRRKTFWFLLSDNFGKVSFCSF